MELGEPQEAAEIVQPEYVNSDSPSVGSHLTILQDVISRMASNSANSKTWSIAVVSAILVVIAERHDPNLVWVAVVPIILFSLLDAYYLALERTFRDRYNDFIRKLHESAALAEDTYIVSVSGGKAVTLRATLHALTSFSVWPFYVVQVAVLLVVRFVLLRA